ncbi:MAG TPA: isoprenylcysteine carboxylmethyltransferase family protein [Bacteroidia bacterium]|nr:isoprenylcysteine carboxylmethyltransferase family protein [Bacteroidia bacterium]
MQTITYSNSFGLKLFSSILVMLKFGLFFAILYAGGLVPLNFFGLGIQLLGVVLYVLAFVSFNKKYFSFMPLPKPGAYIIMHGPYSFLRHPMYLAMILITLPLTYEYFNFKIAMLQLSFMVVIGLLVYIEEYVFGNVDLNYKNYIKYTKMILPLLF